MNKFIELIRVDDSEPIFMNVSNVLYFERYDIEGGTVLITNQDKKIVVKQNPEDVAKLIKTGTQKDK